MSFNDVLVWGVICCKNHFGYVKFQANCPFTYIFSAIKNLNTSFRNKGARSFNVHHILDDDDHNDDGWKNGPRFHVSHSGVFKIINQSVGVQNNDFSFVLHTVIRKEWDGLSSNYTHNDDIPRKFWMLLENWIFWKM